MRDEMLGEIKSRGHWRINFRPRSLKDRLISLDSCLQAVTRSRVSLRGWDYPHIPVRDDDDGRVLRLESCVEGYDDWRDHRELWRMYLSSQFIHYKALPEDWNERDLWLTRTDPPQKSTIPSGSILGIGYQTWSIAEVFEFLYRLSENGLYEYGAEVSVSLQNTEGRILKVEDAGRVPFSHDRRTDASKLTYARELTRSEIAEPRVRAAEALLFFFDKFGWTPAIEQVMLDINQLYKLDMGDERPGASHPIGST